MFACWSSASSFDNFPKSADFASVCPFHYNHWSCEGGKNGGRDHASRPIPRCRCKVSFEMQNGFSFRPFTDKCHLLHFNDNKVRPLFMIHDAFLIYFHFHSLCFTHGLPILPNRQSIPSPPRPLWGRTTVPFPIPPGEARVRPGQRLRALPHLQALHVKRVKRGTGGRGRGSGRGRGDYGQRGPKGKSHTVDM